MSYASVEDYEARWGTLSGDAEAARCETLLEDATMVLDEAVARYFIDIDAKAGVLRIVCCDLAHRRMEAMSASPVTSITQQAGSFAETVRWKPRTSSAMVLTDDDLRQLGVSLGSVTWGIPGARA